MINKRAKKSTKKATARTKVLLTINSFGPLLSVSDLQKLSDDSQDVFIIHLVKSLESFFERPFSILKREVLKRYIEITNKETHVIFAPAYPNIIERIVKPLVIAKRHYSLGEYISCIAVSGIICEMLAILIWKMSIIKIHGKDISADEEEKIFGEDIESVGQKRRLDILFAFVAISDDLFTKFNNVRETRNKYLHAWEYDTRQQKGDAKRLILTTLLLFKEVINMKLVVDKSGNQSVSINPRLHKFLQDSNTKSK